MASPPAAGQGTQAPRHSQMHGHADEMSRSAYLDPPSTIYFFILIFYSFFACPEVGRGNVTAIRGKGDGDQNGPRVGCPECGVGLPGRHRWHRTECTPAASTPGYQPPAFSLHRLAPKALGQEAVVTETNAKARGDP